MCITQFHVCRQYEKHLKVTNVDSCPRPIRKKVGIEDVLNSLQDINYRRKRRGIYKIYLFSKTALNEENFF